MTKATAALYAGKRRQWLGKVTRVEECAGKQATGGREKTIFKRVAAILDGLFVRQSVERTREKGGLSFPETPPSVIIRWWFARYTIFGIQLCAVRLSLFGCLYSILPSIIAIFDCTTLFSFCGNLVTMDLPPHRDYQTI
jgi:hypothetical protein